MTKPFIGVADDGQEKALRRGQKVPQGAVNLAWAKAPPISPKNNLVIIDTSNIIEENTVISARRKRLAFANAVGILEDEDGNQVWEEEYPTISDRFTVDEDYTDESILPYMHVGRYFHLDFAGMQWPGMFFEYKYHEIKVTDKSGNNFVDDDGNNKYRIYLVGAPAGLDPSGDSSIYRPYVFFDADPNLNELYLSYNKVEVTKRGALKNNNISHKEIVNARPYYKYLPEESDVIDHSNLKQTVFSTKPITVKEQVLGLPQPHVQGWKIFVPRKALNDPRLFQLFRWRVGCEFIQKVQVDPNKTFETIKCGILITNSNSSSYAPYTFFNLNKTEYNFNQVRFINPLQSDHAESNQQNASYWYVNLDTVTEADLKKFDLLVLCPSSSLFPLADPLNSYMPKINYFVETIGGTLIVDTASWSFIPDVGVGMTGGVNGETGVPTGPSAYNPSLPLESNAVHYNETPHYIDGSTIVAPPPPLNGTDSELFHAAEAYGGWDFDVDDIATISPFKRSLFGFKKAQYITSTSAPGWETILEANATSEVGSPEKPVLVRKQYASGGNLFVTTIGVAAFVSAVFDFRSGDLITSNRGAVVSAIAFGQYSSQYGLHMSSTQVEGAMKLMLNLALLSTKLKSIDSADEFTFSSSFVAYSDWTPSWVINADNDVLSQSEKQTYKFLLLPTGPGDSEVVWQRSLSDQTLKQIIDAKLTDEQKVRVATATRRYTIYTTNPQVVTPAISLLGDDSAVRAWTLAYSPAFVVPFDFGPHVVRAEEQKGEYEAGNFTYKSFPAKPFSVQSMASFVTTSQTAETIDSHVSITGTATQTIEIPPILISPGQPERVIDIDLYWSRHGTNLLLPSPYPWESGAPNPYGMQTWQQLHYYDKPYNSSNLNWQYWGANTILSVARGSSGEWVKFVQEAFNRFYYMNSFTGYVPSSHRALNVDGYYGAATEAQVRDFQRHTHATWIDGVIDAQTWSLIGWMVLKCRHYNAANGGIGGINPYDHTRFFAWPEQYMRTNHTSDDNFHSVWAKRSWITLGTTTGVRAPLRITEGINIRFNRTYTIHAVTVIPFLFDSQSRSMFWDWLAVAQDINFDPAIAPFFFPGIIPPGQIQRYIWADTPYRVGFWPLSANGIALGVAQDQPAYPYGGFGNERIMGLRDVIAHGKDVVGAIPPVYSQGRTIQNTVPITYETDISVSTGTAVSVMPVVNWTGQGALSNIRWTSVTATNPLYLHCTYVSYPQEHPTIPLEGQTNWVGAITNWTRPSFRFIHFQANNDTSGNTFTYGPKLGVNSQEQYYTMTPAASIDPYARSDGYISKQDGVRLLCQADGKPKGFPTLMPNDWTTGQSKYHYAKFTLNTENTDTMVYVGFYDQSKKEFIEGPDGADSMSYAEYIGRGPANVYIAVLSKYEINTTQDLPPALDAPPLPYRWAMPVYGVTIGARSKIQLKPLPPNLGVSDLWSLPIKAGAYTRPVTIRPRSEGSLTGFLKDYQGSQITAYYGVPEAKLNPWSDIYGRPYTDVKNETPLILDDNVIQVRQPPILQVQEPTTNGYPLTDPWHPVMKIYKRFNLDLPWVEVPADGISDFNTNNGTIILASDLYSNDPHLVKVEYTSSRGFYNLKHDGVVRINLNPYVNEKPQWLNKPLYIYVSPEYCTDSNNAVITASVKTRTIKLSETNSIFDPLQSDYDPVAVLIGVIYITNTFNINELILLDTRRRGGGASSSLNEEEVVRMVGEASSYWDINYGTATSYQKGGFVIIRLPRALEDDIDEDEIIEAIERNITAGVRYKIEDLEGNSWS